MPADLLPMLTKAYRDKETLPKKFNTGELVNLLQGIYEAKTSGTKFSKTAEAQLTPEKVGNRILKEGRTDAGANEFDVNNKRAMELYRAVSDATMPYANRDSGARFAAAVMDKAGVADRTGLSFDRLYNGAGKSKESGRTGAQYSKELAAAQGAIDDPRNANFKDLIQRGLSGKLTSSEVVAGLPEDTLLDILVGERKVNARRDIGSTAMYDEASNIISQTAKKLNISGDRLKAVEKDLGDYGTGIGLVNIFPSAYKKAAGVDIPSKDSKTLAGFGPDTNAILNALTGVDPIK